MKRPGIAGYIVYIDGFKAEIPNADGDPSKWDEDVAGSPPSADSFDELPIGGYKLSMANFKKMAYTNGEKLESKENYQETFYEPNEVFKMVSDKYTEKQKALEKGKSLCAPLYKFTGFLDGQKKEMILIKEGTVIGRTMCNAEYVKSIRKEEFVSKKKKIEKIEKKLVDDTRELVEGNYIRIVFRTRDDEVVENVEDYLKLSTGENDEQAGTQEYEFQENDLELLADAIHHEGCGAWDDPSGSYEDQLYCATCIGYSIINKLNSDSGYNNLAGMNWAPDKSPLYNIVCVVPCAFHHGKGWYAISDDPDSTDGGIKNRADKGNYEYCDQCMEAAEFIKDNDSMNFTNNGKYRAEDGAYTNFSAGDPMPHTCWEQGSNVNSKYKVWAHFKTDYISDVAP